MSSEVPLSLVNHQSKGVLPGINPENQVKIDGKMSKSDIFQGEIFQHGKNDEIQGKIESHE